MKDRTSPYLHISRLLYAPHPRGPLWIRDKQGRTLVVYNWSFDLLPKDTTTLLHIIDACWPLLLEKRSPHRCVFLPPYIPGELRAREKQKATWA